MSSNPNVSNTPAPLSFAAPTIREALDDATGLIPARVARVGITLDLTGGGITLPTDWMSVQMRLITFPETPFVTVDGPFQVLTRPITRFIPVFPPPQFTHGFYEIKNTQARDSLGLPGPVFDESFIAPFRVDTIAPYAVGNTREKPDAPIFANVPPDTVIDDVFLVANGGVEFTIPPNTYSDQTGQFEVGDVVNFYLSREMFPTPGDLLTGAGLPMTAAGATFFVNAADIRLLLGGLCYAFYTMTDRAGNESSPSNIAFRTLALLDDPVPEEPFLPLAPAPRGGSTDDLLDIVDYQRGIEAYIEEYMGNAPGLDQFEMQWEMEPYSPQSRPLSTFPVVFDDNTYNMNDAIKAAYTATLGPQTVRVHYRIERNGIFYPSPVKTVRLDLSVEGPVLDPTLEPGSVNPALNLAQVFGTGPTPVLNELHIEDADLPVRIDIPLWTIAALPNANHQFFLFWGTSKERVGPFSLSTTVPGDTATFEIPWEVVARHGNGFQEVSYVVIGPGTTNENPSGITRVNVIDAVTVVLLPAIFRHLDANGRWSCESLLVRTPGTRPVLYTELFIPADPRLVVGNTVTVMLTLWNHSFIPVPPYLPGPFEVTITTPPLTQNDVDNGLIVEVDYRPIVVQSVYGPAEVTYTTVVDTGATGRGQLAGIDTVFSSPHHFCDGEPSLPLP